MSVISMKALLESGVHFGHRTEKWHPAMKQYIFTERNGIHIIDLQKTSKAVETAYNLVRDIVTEGGNLLFVGTKRQAQETIQEEAIRCGMPYVTARWLGGMLTNWRTIRQRVNELDRLERMRDKGDFERITKKEALILSRKIERLDMLLGGIRQLNHLPEALFVIDVFREATAVHEANLLKIPVVALVDTNCDPSNIDYVIPSNDDAIRAIKLLVAKMADAVVEGKALRKDVEEEVTPVELRVAEVEESELTDEDLLGEATLAKLTSKPKAVVEEEPELASEPQPEVEQAPEPEPAAVQEPEPAAVQEPEPAAVQEPEPAAVQEPEPAAVQEPEPAAAPVADDLVDEEWEEELEEEERKFGESVDDEDFDADEDEVEHDEKGKD
jgi:small subunit ribosomal protein S2